MSVRDRTDEQLRSYFRERIDGIRERPTPRMGFASSEPPAIREPRTTRAQLWITRLAVAAVFAAALWAPIAGAGRVSPGAAAFAVVHEEIGTARIVTDGLEAAHRFMSTYFTGVNR
jgi:anti-sigma factor RsiW